MKCPPKSSDGMNTDSFDYTLPSKLIAQSPVTPRDRSRLLVLDRETGQLAHRRFADLRDYLRAGDLLVANDSRVIRARLFGRKPSGGRVELLLLEPLGDCRWKALVGGKKITAGTEIALDRVESGVAPVLMAVVTADLGGPLREVQFNMDIEPHLNLVGHPPLPPYISQELADFERYQTVYARPLGSAAAPTAGLHFTPELLVDLRRKGVAIEMVTLHVGLDTFKPVESAKVEEHRIHSEWVSLTADAAKRINEAILSGGRVFAVGTTTVRTLETAALRSAGMGGSLQGASRHGNRSDDSGFCPWRPVVAYEGRTDLFIYPGYRFRVVDGLITNFHLPKSSLLMLVAAFAGLEEILAAYETAVSREYRFYSFGDAMLIS